MMPEVGKSITAYYDLDFYGKWQGPTPCVCLREMSVLQRVYSYSKLTGKWQGPTPGVHLIENIVTVK